MASPALNPLAMALVNGGYGGSMSGINPMSMDPSFLTLQPQMQMGQGLIQEGTDSSPAYPMQALARALQGVTGAYMLSRAAGKLTQGMAGSNAAGDAAIVNVLGGPQSKLGQAYINGDYYTRYAIKSQIGQLAVEQGKPQVVSPGQDVQVGGQTVGTNTGPTTEPFKAINDFNHLPPEQRALGLSALGKQLQDAGIQYAVNQDGTMVAGRVAGGPADPGVIAQNTAAAANAQVPAHIAESGASAAQEGAQKRLTDIIDVPMWQNGVLGTQQMTVAEYNQRMGVSGGGAGGGSVPPPPAVGGGAVIPPAASATTPPVQPVMPAQAQPAAPATTPAASVVQPAMPPEVPQLRPDAPVVPGATGGGPEGMQINPTLAADATPLAPPPASPAIPVAPPVVPGPAANAPAATNLGFKPTANPAIQPLVDNDAKEVATDRETAAKGQTDIALAKTIQDFLPKVATGWSAETKLEAGRILQGLGTDPAEIQKFLGIDPTAGQLLMKNFTSLSAAAARNMGAREPGSVISMFAKAYPNLGTTPQAIIMQTNAVIMDRLRAQELATQKTNYLNDSVNALQGSGKYRGLQGFNEQFNKTHSGEMYLHGAEAMSKMPEAWKAVTDPAQQQMVIDLIPSGTTFLAPDGQMRVKP